MAAGSARTVVLTERVPAPSISAAGRRSLGAFVVAYVLRWQWCSPTGAELVLVVTLSSCAGAEVLAGRRAVALVPSSVQSPAGPPTPDPPSAAS